MISIKRSTNTQCLFNYLLSRLYISRCMITARATQCRSWDISFAQMRSTVVVLAILLVSYEAHSRALSCKGSKELPSLKEIDGGFEGSLIMPRSDPVVGIDLGTTYSGVGVWQNDRVEIIANDQDNRATPSYVAFMDTERLRGDATKNPVALNPKDTVFDAKRMISRMEKVKTGRGILMIRPEDYGRVQRLIEEPASTCNN